MSGNNLKAFAFIVGLLLYISFVIQFVIIQIEGVFFIYLIDKNKSLLRFLSSL